VAVWQGVGGYRGGEGPAEVVSRGIGMIIIWGTFMERVEKRWCFGRRKKEAVLYILDR